MERQISNLTLMGGADIPFISGAMMIRQPRIKDIAVLGEQRFFQGCSILMFSKETLPTQDKITLESYSDFDILMQILLRANGKENFQNLFADTISLFIPNRAISFSEQPAAILFEDLDGSKKVIHSGNYGEFKDIVSTILCIKDEKNKKLFNPAGELSRQIAEKIQKYRSKIENQKKEEYDEKYYKYLSILSVGLPIDLEVLLNYTLYQFNNLFVRFQRKQRYEEYFKARLAGADKIDTVESWMLEEEEKEEPKGKQMRRGKSNSYEL